MTETRLKRRRLSKEQIDEIYRRANRGQAATQIAEEMELRYNTVWGHIRAWRTINPAFGRSENIPAKKSVLSKVGLSVGPSILRELSRADMDWLVGIALDAGHKSLNEAIVDVLRDLREQEEEEVRQKLKRGS